MSNVCIRDYYMRDIYHLFVSPPWNRVPLIILPLLFLLQSSTVANRKGASVYYLQHTSNDIKLFLSSIWCNYLSFCILDIRLISLIHFSGMNILCSWILLNASLKCTNMMGAFRLLHFTPPMLESNEYYVLPISKIFFSKLESC